MMTSAKAELSVPETETGEQKSSSSTRNHGLYAATLLFRDENDLAEFELMAEGFKERLIPRDSVEELMVSRIVSMHWRVLQFNQREQIYWRDCLDADPNKYTRAIAAAERSLDRACKELENLRKGKYDSQPSASENYGTNPSPLPKPKAIRSLFHEADESYPYQPLFEKNPVPAPEDREWNSTEEKSKTNPTTPTELPNAGNYETNSNAEEELTPEEQKAEYAKRRAHYAIHRGRPETPFYNQRRT